MGVFADEENLSHTIRQQITSPGMHWQQHQHERYVGPAYDPSRDLSPNLPACDATASSMGSSSGPNTNNSDNEPPCAVVKVSGSLCSTPSGTSNSSSTSSSSSNSSTSSGSACSTPSHNNNNNNIQCHQTNPSINNNNNNNNNSTCALSSSEMCRISSHDYHNQHFPPIQIPKLEPVTTPPPPSSNRSYGQNSVNDVLSASGDVDDDNIRTRTSATLSGHCKNNNNSPLAAICAGCGQLISDKFYLQAVDRRWHAACLQCYQCRHTLDGEVTCFTRNGNIYCKKDYYRLFGMKRCARCQASILSTELVMRARDLVFHVHCFTCEICNAPLTKGDHFGMRDAAVLCRLHYEMSSHHESSSPSGMIPQIRGGGLIPPPTSGGPLGGCQPHGGVLIPGHSPSSGLHSNTVPPPPGSGNLHHYPPSFPSPSDFHHNMSPGGGGSGHHPHISPSPQLTSQPPPPGSMGDTNKVPSFYNGAPTSTPRQKGRPRKRKPKDIESMTANLDINSDYLDMPFGRSPGTPGMHGSSSRTKRMRTSFKHHQLRTMKSYFAINHNPDAKDLKQLSQKTGLPKRVLQVWFQNARAKWRRMMQKQEGKSGDKCSGSESGGINDLDLYPHGGPGSLTGSIQSLPPHSPQFLLGPGSPNSLDCT